MGGRHSCNAGRLMGKHEQQQQQQQSGGWAPAPLRLPPCRLPPKGGRVRTRSCGSASHASTPTRSRR